MVEISLAYEGGLRCVSIHGPSGASVSTDAPKDNMGLGEAFSPTDLTCTSLGACMLTTMAIAIVKKSLKSDITGAKALVRKHMTAEPPRRIAQIDVELDFPPTVVPEEKSILEEVAMNCPVSLSLSPEVEQAVMFRWAN